MTATTVQPPSACPHAEPTQSHGPSARGFDCAPLPAATPPWITPELVEHTLRVWQPRCTEPLSIDEAIAMILRIGRLSDVLGSAR